MKHLAVVVDWYGPYSRDEALYAARHDYGPGLYVGIGKCHYQHGDPVPQYIGLSKTLGARLSQHPKLPEITRGARIWLGEVATAETPGPKRKRTPESLDSTEWLHAYFLKLPLNERKKWTPPQRPATVLNRWWRTDRESPWVKRPHPLWPDLFDYLGPDLPARLVWFGGKQKRVRPPFQRG